MRSLERVNIRTNERTYVLTYIRTGQTLYPLHNFVVRGDKNNYSNPEKNDSTIKLLFVTNKYIILTSDLSVFYSMFNHIFRVFRHNVRAGSRHVFLVSRCAALLQWNYSQAGDTDTYGFRL